MGQQFNTALDIAHMATPANPVANRALLYVKTDGKVYAKDSAGAEALIGPSAAAASTPRGIAVETTPTLGVSSTPTKQPLTGTVLWNDGDFTLSTGDLLCATAGRYSVTGTTAWNIGSVEGARMQVEVEKNGVAASPRISQTLASPTQTGQRISVSGFVNLVVGDRLSIVATQFTGADRTPIDGALAVEKVGPGATGSQGVAGQGVPVGGTTGQLLAKTSGTDYATAWTTSPGIPTGGTTNQVLAKTSGTDYAVGWANQVPTEVAYAEFTANVNITATTAGTSQLVVAAAAFTYAAVPYEVEFYCPMVIVQPTASAQIFIGLYDGSAATPIGRIAQLRTPAAATNGWPVQTTHRLTPTAASHTYQIRAYVTAATSTCSAGTGAGDTHVPGHIKISRL